MKNIKKDDLDVGKFSFNDSEDLRSENLYLKDQITTIKNNVKEVED